MPSFSDIANKKLGDIERPPLPPVGTWKMLVTKVTGPRDQGQWEVIDFHLRGIEPRGDVDANDAATFGDPGKINLRKSFMFDKEDAVGFLQTENNMKRFMVDHLRCATDDDSLKQGMNAAVNCPVLADISYKPDKNNEGEFFANVGKTAPLSA